MNLKHRSNRFLEAGEKLIRQKGYQDTSLNDILDLMDAPKGSFYNYFRSKEDFTLRVIHYYGERMSKFIENFLRDRHYTPLNRLENLYRALIDINKAEEWRKGCLVNNILTEEGGKKTPLGTEANMEFRKWIKKIAECVKEGQENGEIINSDEPETIAEYLHGGFFGAMSLMKGTRNEQPLLNWYDMSFKIIKND